MNFFNLRDLEERLINKEITEREGFYYLLANFIILSLPSPEAYNNSYFLVAEIFVYVAFISLLIYQTYHINTSGDGAEYLKRFLSLNFVVGARISAFAILFLLPTYVIYAFAFGGAFPADNIYEDYFDFSLMAILSIIFYLLVTNSFKRISSKTSDVSPTSG